MKLPFNPKTVAQRGERIYRERYRSKYERRYRGKFVAIDVDTKAAHLSESPEVALADARAQNPDGLFHLIRVGSLGAFRLSYTSNANLDWLL